MIRGALAILVGAMVVGCAGTTDPETRTAPEELTALPRELTADETRTSRAANQFAFSLFRRLSAVQPDSNVFVSPLSVSFALGMTMNGAKGTTLDEMRATLGFGGEELTAINAGYRGLLGLQHGLDPTTTFEIANSVWYRTGLVVYPSFIETVRAAFDADVKASPFDQTTVKAINDWADEKTHGKINKVIDAIRPELVMFLINAIYFKGAWRQQFDPGATRDASFASIDGPQPMKLMRQPKMDVRLGGVPDAQLIELPYGNGAFVMTIVLPNPGVSLARVAATLDTAAWSRGVADLREVKSEVGLPKFRMAYDRQLNDDLRALGMNVPFIGNVADFTGMSPAGRQMYIDFVKHNTFVDVNEEGTEAAAVTVVGVGLTSAPACLCIDRPFLFVIRERFSGTILFMGQIVRIPRV